MLIFKIELWLILILSFPLSGQIDINYSLNEKIDLYVTGQDVGYQTQVFEDKIFYLGSVVDSLTNNFNTSITLLDTNGTFLATKRYGFLNYLDFSVNKTIKKNSHVYGIGQTFLLNDTVYDIDFLFAKFNENGDTVFTKILHDTGSIAAYDIQPFNSSSFIVLTAYGRNYQNVNLPQIHLMVIDTLGNVLASSYTIPGQEIPSVLVFDNLKNEIYVFGVYPSQPGGNWYFINFLRCFDGTTLQTKYLISALTGKKNDYINSAILYDGTIYASFTARVPPDTPDVQYKDRIKIAKIKPSIQSFSSQLVGAKGINATSGNIIAHNGRLIFPVFNNYTRQTIFFCDTSLSMACFANITSFDNSTYCSGSHINILRSNKIIQAGSCVGDYSWYHWLFISEDYEKFINEDCSILIGEKENDLESNSFILYPNPANEVVNLKINAPAGRKFSLTITDLTGNLLKKIEIDSGMTGALNIANYETSVYFLILYSEGKAIETTKLAIIR